MRHTTRSRFLSLLLSGALALAPVPLLAAVYKCGHNGQVVYSDAPCGKNPREVNIQPVVVPSLAPEAAPAKQPWSLRGLASSLGLDDGSGAIGALLFGIPLSFIAIFLLTRKSANQR